MESDLGQGVTPEAFIRNKRVVFWDFDGVIKESVPAKSAAFEQLFWGYGKDVVARVRRHHEAHLGVSRYEKIPLYLAWAGEVATSERVAEFCTRFALQVQQAVIDAPWVPGVRELLEERYEQQYFVLVTATPQDEINRILAALGLAHCFREVHGAPCPKTEAIATVLGRIRVNPEEALMVGDAEADFIAASRNKMSFLLRRTPLSLAFQACYDGPSFDNLNHANGVKESNE